MSEPRWTHVERLFEGALERPAEKRAEWLEAECGDDATLREEVKRLLAAHEVRGLLDFTPPRPFPLQERVARAFEDRYVVERELGAGGMATVYLARERKHDRAVVIKVLNPDLAAWWGGDRFLREIRIAAKLSHPHIVGLIDSGETDGLLYYVMPFVEGETLRARLDRERILPLGESLALLKDIANALAYAHATGVVHRDLKPANVLCSGDHAFLMDFGVAKLLEPVTGDGHQTGLGVVIGTPAYMAPEQVRGETTIDHRADLYAWGLLAFEMLTGRLPAEDEISEAGARSPRSLRRPEIPRDLVRLIERCLAREPSMRPASADVLVERIGRLTTGEGALGRRSSAAVVAVRSRPLAVGSTLAVGAAIVLTSWRMLVGDPAPAVGVRGPIAVATLANETGDPALDYWGRMAGDWITQGLQETGLVSVVPWPTALQASERATAERLAGRASDPVEFMRQETGAGTVITGAYYLVGDSLQFRVEVSDASARRLIGAPPTTSSPRDSAHLAIRTLRDRLMGTIAIWSDERFANVPGIDRQPPKFEAYQAFDRALQRYVAQDYRGAAPELRQAYELDTTFLVPLVHAASAYFNTRQLDAADTVLRIVLSRQNELNDYYRWIAESLDAGLVSDGERAVAALRRAAESAPGSRAWYNLALALISVDRPADALDALRRLDPDRGDMRGWSSYWTQLTHALHLVGDHEAELDAARSLRTRFPDRRVGIVLEARALGALGRSTALDSVLEASLPLPPTTYWSQGAAMVVAGEEMLAHGDAPEARRWLERGVAWLEQQLAVTPGHTGHRYWLGSALYDLRRWNEAHRLFDELAREDPDDLQYRGLAAVAAARLGDRTAERRLGDPPEFDRGEYLSYRARIAAIRGDPERAATLFADAVRHGVGGMAWLHASAHHDLEELRSVRGQLPLSLRNQETRTAASRRAGRTRSPERQ